MDETDASGHQDDHIAHLGGQLGDGHDDAIQQGHRTSSGRGTGGRTLRRGDVLQRWGWAVLVVGALVAVAHVTRYDHWHDAAGREYVWDRWTHRSCAFIVWRPSLPTVCRTITTPTTGAPTMQDATPFPQDTTH